MPTGERRGFASDYRESFDTLCVLARVAAFPVAVWTTRFGTWGARYLTGAAVLGTLWPGVFAAFAGPHPRAGDLLVFWALTVALLLVHRVAGVVRRWRGYRCHTRYWGVAWVEGGPGLASQRRARRVVGLLVLGAGYLAVRCGSGPLGAFLMLGAVAKLVADAVDFQAVEARLDQMADARIETEYYADLYRERHG